MYGEKDSIDCEDKKSGTIFKLILDKDMVDKLKSVLNEKETKVIDFRFGFEENAMTLQEIGNKLNLTRERVRQIQDKALLKLTERMEKLK